MIRVNPFVFGNFFEILSHFYFATVLGLKNVHWGLNALRNKENIIGNAVYV